MAETAVGLAKTVGESVLKSLSSAAADEIGKLLGVRQEIRYIKDEFEMMQEFLMVAEEGKENQNRIMRTWVRQVKDLAYDIEDCLSEFSLHLERRSLWYKLRALGARHRIANQIRDIKARVQEASERNSRYRLVDPQALNSDATASYTHSASRQKALFIEDVELVGLDAKKKALIGKIKRENGERQVLWVDGMGGLGKTTLVRKVYDSRELGGEFECRAWITVSQSFNPMDLIREMNKQCNVDLKGVSTLEQHTSKLKDHLREKKYMVVLDDLWSTEAWEKLEHAFPENNNGSCVVVTTRNAAVAESCRWSSSQQHHLTPLSDPDSRELFLRRVHRSQQYKDLPPSLEEVASKILKKCGGLPLAIVTIGGLLSTKMMVKKEWDKLLGQLGSELETNPDAKAMKEVVTLSYKDLPHHLKSCFLYLSIFPEDFEIRWSRLVNRWIAEGFVRERRGMTLEEVAEEYFYELIDRSLIQPSQLSIDGRVKTCRVHDVLREIILAKSIEENLVFIMDEDQSRKPKENVRHLVLSNSREINGLEMSGIRSLTVFNQPMPPCVSRSPSLSMVRVLDLEDMDNESDDEYHALEGAIQDLRLLKYISLRSLYLRDGLLHSKSFRNLRDLLILDVRGSVLTRLPDAITKLQKLRAISAGDFWFEEDSSMLRDTCVAFYRSILGTDEEIRSKKTLASTIWNLVLNNIDGGWGGIRVPKGIGNLKELQILEYVDVERSNSSAVEELGKLTQLRKLGVRGVSRKNGQKLCDVLSKLRRLRSLKIGLTSKEACGCLDDVSKSSPPSLLRSIKLRGPICKLPTWISSLANLAKMYLFKTKLEDDALGILQEVPNLMLLFFGMDSYTGTKLVFQSGKFTELRKLQIFNLEILEAITFEDGTLPKFETIYIGGCDLRLGISGVEHLPSLKNIELGWNTWVANLDELRGIVDAHPNSNHPVLSVTHPQYQERKQREASTAPRDPPPVDLGIADESPSSVQFSQLQSP